MEYRRMLVLAAYILVIGACLLLIAFTVAKVLGSGDHVDLRRLESEFRKHTHKDNQTIEELNSKLRALTGKFKNIGEEERADPQNTAEFLHQLSLNMSTIEAKMDQKLRNISQELQAMIQKEASAQKVVNEELSNGMTRLKILMLLSNHVSQRPTTAPEELWNITYACQVFKDPELTDLRSEIPEKISVIFSNDTKAIETGKWRRQLTIDNDLRLRTTRFYNITNGLKHWKFQAVDGNCEHFLILHVGMNVALGVVKGTNSDPSDQLKRIDYQPLDAIRGDSRYHWKILLKHLIITTYYQFINHDTGVILAANDDSDVLPYTYTASDNICKDWELE